jgi:hypothetical protein
MYDQWFYIPHGRDHGRKRWYFRPKPTGYKYWVVIRGDGHDWFAELWPRPSERVEPEVLFHADNIPDLKKVVETWAAIRGHP